MLKARSLATGSGGWKAGSRACAVALEAKPEEYARVKPRHRDQNIESNMSQYLSLPVEQTVHFGPYRVHPRQRLVLEGGQPLRLGRRAVEILLVLLEHAGEVVSKQQLIARVWPRSVVEDTNLRVHVAALRKALGDGQAGQRYIVTVAQRGYSFVAPLSFEPFDQWAHIPHPSLTRNLPLQRTRMIGRQALVENLVAQLPRKRFITLVGTGGIGKTTVALRVAERLIGQYRDGTHLLDLASLNDAAMIAPNLCALLDLPLQDGDPLDAIARQLKERHLLLVIDNCEHLIDAIALLSETLLRGAPTCTSWPPAAKACAPKANTCSAWTPWRSRPGKCPSRATPPWNTRRCNCLPNGRWPAVTTSN